MKNLNKIAQEKAITQIKQIQEIERKRENQKKDSGSLTRSRGGRMGKMRSVDEK